MENLESVLHSHPHPRDHSYDQGWAHSHIHGAIDPEITTSEQGLWAVKWSFVGLLITASIQALVFVLSGSVALLADLIHNIADASTAIPLALAFWANQWQPTRRFSYGYGRAEDLAGVAVVVIIAFSAAIAGWESIDRFLHPQPLDHLEALAAAGMVGFIGNIAVSRFRIRVGEAINSAALIADGYHAQADAVVSLAVVLGAFGVWLGYPIVDPILGLLITGVLLRVVWETGTTMMERMLDGVDPEILDQIHHGVHHVDDVRGINTVRARWLGHQLRTEIDVMVNPDLTVGEAHTIAERIQRELQVHIPYLAYVTVQTRPDRS